MFQVKTLQVGKKCTNQILSALLLICMTLSWIQLLPKGSLLTYRWAVSSLNPEELVKETRSSWAFRASQMRMAPGLHVYISCWEEPTGTCLQDCFPKHGLLVVVTASMKWLLTASALPYPLSFPSHSVCCLPLMWQVLEQERITYMENSRICTLRLWKEHIYIYI